ncbi:MAG: ABC transporter permease [Gemella sp.]|nr:ABC transporter permease [Gemella sp.]
MSNLNALLKIEFILFRRNWVSFIIGIGLPVMIFLLMSSMMEGTYPEDIRPYVVKTMLVSMTIYSSISFGIYSLPMLFIEDKNNRWVNFVGRTNIKIWQYYLAKVIRVVSYFLVSIVVVFSTGKFIKDVEFEVKEWITLALLIVFGAVCMMSIGFVLTLIKSVEKVSAVSNIIFIFLSMIGGLWWPLNGFPEFLQKIGKLTPTYHINHLAQQYIFKDVFESKSFFILIAYAVVLIGLTLILKKKIK